MLLSCRIISTLFSRNDAVIDGVQQQHKLLKLFVKENHVFACDRKNDK